MKQLAYKIIYNAPINYVLRNVTKGLGPLVPKNMRIPPSGSITIKNPGGKSMKLLTNQTNYLTYLVYWDGGYEQFEYTDIFVKLIKKIDTFYDIGANIGFYSLVAAMKNPDIKVVGFEPALGPLHYFEENVRVNDYKNIKIESIALSHKEGTIEFYEIKNKKYSYLEHNLAGESNAGSQTEGRNFVLNEVKTATLDNYVETNKEARIDLIKMDTEGTEHLILEKATRVLSEMQPIVICETLFDTIEPELEKIMKGYGYDFYNHHDKQGLRKADTIIRTKDDGVRNCFFVHPSKYHLIEEFVVK